MWSARLFGAYGLAAYIGVLNSPSRNMEGRPAERLAAWAERGKA